MKRPVCFILAGIVLSLGLCQPFRSALFWRWQPVKPRPGNALTAADCLTELKIANTRLAAAQGAAPRHVSGMAQSMAGVGRISKRSWDHGFLTSLRNRKERDPISFELINGQFASGTIGSLVKNGEEVAYVFGLLAQPQAGRFFFQRQTRPGVAGSFVGVIEFAAGTTAYRIEPTGPEGKPELVERPLSRIKCIGLAAPGGPAVSQAVSWSTSSDNPAGPIPPYQNGIIALESLPGAGAVIYLDFEGGYTAAWGGIAYDSPKLSNAQIADIWARVKEDFLPFNINVTTDLAVFQRAPEGSRQHVIITPTTTAAPGEGGIAYVGSFNWTGDTPCWVFNLSGNFCAQSCSHEAGHTLGLNHEGLQIGDSVQDYYSGQGTGETSWAPIMGISYYANVGQWCKGEYLHADNQEDQLDRVATENNNVSYRQDDAGDTLATARFLQIQQDGTAQAQGIIERTDDTDAYRFTTAGGAVALRADPASLSPNLAVSVALRDSQDKLLLRSDPQPTLWTALATNLPPGTYTFTVSGAGRNDPLTNGFSSYASLGYYSITGSVANAQTTYAFAIPEDSTNGAVVGNLGYATNAALGFTILSGNDTGLFGIDERGTIFLAVASQLDNYVGEIQPGVPATFELSLAIDPLEDPDAGQVECLVVIEVDYAAPPAAPLILQQPLGAFVAGGASLFLSVQAAGAAPLQYQWRKDGTAVASGTSSCYWIASASRLDSGAYSVSVSNELGCIISSNAIVRVRTPQQLNQLGRNPDGSFILLSADADGGQIPDRDRDNFVLQASENLLAWSAISNQCVLSNGMLLFRDQQATNLASRFYRVIEN